MVSNSSACSVLSRLVGWLESHFFMTNVSLWWKPGRCSVDKHANGLGNLKMHPGKNQVWTIKPARSQHGESRPWQKSQGRGPDKTQRWDQASGVLPPTARFSRASTPRTKICLFYYIMPFTNFSDINRGLSPHHLFLEKVNLEVLDNKSPGHNNSVSIQKPL